MNSVHDRARLPRRVLVFRYTLDMREPKTADGEGWLLAIGARHEILGGGTAGVIERDDGQVIMADIDLVRFKEPLGPAE